MKGVHKLTKPINFEGREITEISYDLGKLRARDQIQAIRTCGISKPGEMNLIPLMSNEVQAHLFAAASDQPVELILELHLPDFNEICALTLAFTTGQA